MEKNNIDGKQLREWLRENDLLLKLSPAQADTIIKMIQTGGYELEVEGSKIRQVSVDQNGTQVKEITTDDVIELAAEINYELLLNHKEKMKSENAESTLAFVKELKEYLELQNESILLNQAFQQTVCAKKINELLDKYKNFEKETPEKHRAR